MAEQMTRRGLLDPVVDAYNRYIGRPFASVAGGAINGYLGFDRPSFANEQVYRTAQALSGMPGVGAPAGIFKAAANAPEVIAALGGLLGAPKALNKMGKNGKIDIGSESKSASIYDPKPVDQRPFTDDYPQGTGQPDGSRLLFDIERRSISPTALVFGRRSVEGVDEGLKKGTEFGLANDLGARTRLEARYGRNLRGAHGKYIGGENPLIVVDQALPTAKAEMVAGHEIGHLIDDNVLLTINAGGSRIPTDGIKKELRGVYESLNTPGNFKPGKGLQPKDFGYPAKEVDAEYMAEAIRAYMRDPNWIKTVAPSTAKRIREYVNSNPKLNQVVHFNALAPVGAAGLLGASLFSEEQPRNP
jgi:hypothetical protein